jgi:hypothetical protein
LKREAHTSVGTTVGPAYVGVRDERCTMLSPSRATIGMTARASIPRPPRNARISPSMRRNTASSNPTRSSLFTRTATCFTPSNDKSVP